MLQPVTHADLDSTLFPVIAHSSICSYHQVEIGNRIAFVVYGSSTTPVGALGRRYDAALLLELNVSRFGSSSRCYSAIIHTLVVRESSQKRGLGNALLSYAYVYAASTAHAIVFAESTYDEVKHSNKALVWSLAPGSCRRQVDMLRLLHKHGWRIVVNGDTTVNASILLKWQKDEYLELGTRDVQVFGPACSLSTPVILPGEAMDGCASFKHPNEMPSVPPKKDKEWVRSYELNSLLLRGTHPLLPSSDVMPLRSKGLLSFVAPISACAQLERYVADGKNHNFSVNGGELDHTLQVGDVKLKSYRDYHYLNSMHDSQLQACATAMASEPYEIRACVERLPGLAEILQAAAHTIGVDLPLKTLTASVRRLHFLLLDATRQVDFCWHEDTSDLTIHEKERDGLLSIIVQLSATFKTAMQVYGFPYHVYDGQGAGVIFHGRALHRSISRHSQPSGRRVWKLAIFLHPARLCASHNT